MGADLYIIREARQFCFPIMHRTWQVGLRAARLNRTIESAKKSPLVDVAALNGLVAEQSACEKQIAGLVRLVDFSAPFYFRDAYNSLSVLWSLELSWWGDVIPMLDRGNRLQIPDLLRFRRMVLTAEQRFPTKTDLEKSGWIVDGQIRTLRFYHNDLVEGRAELLSFLNRAISKGSAIYCSL